MAVIRAFCRKIGVMPCVVHFNIRDYSAKFVYHTDLFTFGNLRNGDARRAYGGVRACAVRSGYATGGGTCAYIARVVDFDNSADDALVFVGIPWTNRALNRI